jgi:hypothetical protein
VLIRNSFTNQVLEYRFAVLFLQSRKPSAKLISPRTCFPSLPQVFSESDPKFSGFNPPNFNLSKIHFVKNKLPDGKLLFSVVTGLTRNMSRPSAMTTKHVFLSKSPITIYKPLVSNSSSAPEPATSSCASP